MDKKNMRVQCDPLCGFMVQSHSKKELLDIVRMHAKNQHQMNISDEEVSKKIEMIDSPA